MIKIEFAKEEDLVVIASLSKEFEEEHCCNGIKADDVDYFKTKKVAVAKIDDEIVGYCYGVVETKEKDTSFYKKGEKSFYIEELYIAPNYRNINIGKKLFDFIETYAKSLGCKILETTAVSKDYKKLLRFYIEKNNMNFWSASLLKKI